VLLKFAYTNLSGTPMKKSMIILLLPVIFTLISCEKKTGPTEMILDGNIEDQTSNAWQSILPTYTSKDLELTLSTEEYVSPTHSLRISKPTLDADSLGFFVQTFEQDLPFKRKLTLSAKIKCVNLSGSGAAIALRCDGGSPANHTVLMFATTQQTHSIKGTSDWKEYSVTLDEVPDNTTVIMAFLIFLTNTTGTVYFDDIHLVHE
jgi:hypothetical protein